MKLNELNELDFSGDIETSDNENILSNSNNSEIDDIIIEENDTMIINILNTEEYIL